jgi:YesN/AraC family two-component response regulator
MINGISALYKITVKEFGCMISDIKMPHMTGLELLSKIRNIQISTIAFNLISGINEINQSELLQREPKVY